METDRPPIESAPRRTFKPGQGTRARVAAVLGSGPRSGHRVGTLTIREGVVAEERSVESTMEKSHEFDGNRAVSPVLGVIMMVALTILLASVMGVFVIGVGETSQERPPTAQFDVEWIEGNLSIAHTTGDTIRSERLAVAGPDAFEASFSDDTVWSEPWNTRVSAGMERQLRQDGGLPEGTYRLVWRTAGTSAVINEFESPP